MDQQIAPWPPTFFRIQSLCLNVLGCYFEEEKNSAWQRTRSSINCVLAVVLFLSQCYAARESMDDLSFLCHILGLLVGIFLSVIKILAMHFHVHDFGQLNYLLTELSVDVAPNDRIMLMRANKLGQTLSFLNICCLLVSTLTLILYPLGETIYLLCFVTDDPDSLVWPTPFDAKVPFDASHSPIYELVYVFMLYNFIIACFSINAADSTFVEASLLVRCHFQGLRRDIARLNNASLDAEIKRTAVYHKRILAAKDSLQKSFSRILPFFVVIAPTMFGLFVVSALRVRICLLFGV